MARKQAVFTGVMKFGMIAVPVKFYKPHFEADEAPSFHMEHNCGYRVEDDKIVTHLPSGVGIKRPWFCPCCNKMVPYDELLSVADNGVALTRSEVKGAKIDEKEFIIEEFVDASEVDPMHLGGDIYFIEMDGNSGVDAYSVMTLTLRHTNKVGIATWTSRGSDKVVVVRPYREGLVVQVLNYGNLQNAPDYGTRFNDDVVDMARMMTKMVEKRTVKFEPSKYKSEYVSNLRALVNKECDQPVAQVKCKKTSSLREMLAAMEAA